MRIFISVDIEGVAGVAHGEQGRQGNPEYERARRLMGAEANAAIAGAFDGGASEVIVNDSHGQMRNLIAEDLDPRARLISGRPKPLFMMQGLTRECAGALLIGYHACAGAERGVLAHTINGKAFARTSINGKPIGEAGINGALAGEMGVPILMASGDDVYEAEMGDYFPHARFARVKTAIGVNCADSLAPQAACALIRDVAAEAVRAAKTMPLMKLGAPLHCEARFNTLVMADLVAGLPGTSRIDGHTIGFVAPDALTALRMLTSMSAMAASLP